ncbi:Predicted phosphoesterase, NUDIX family [Burkholderia sp. WP9]|uniref:HTH domain-containing protein n=1 Tax=Burkholderia sp. WP9 TaxID=1500263 RepID=UPI0008967BD5|nr:HTH domain-containing protein [Burkholderia sp. WP9]SED49549.1 Predicted phosphoesterase, NUDIX family [Burkholderia sp. WP9]
MNRKISDKDSGGVRDDFELTGKRQMTFLELAEHYLRIENKPLSAREIVGKALRDGTLVSAGKTPWQTMKSKLSTDILTHGESSRFKRVFQGSFALREYDADEYVATRFMKSKLDEDIAVIPRSKLAQIVDGVGYFPAGIDRFKLSRLATPMLRRQAEESFDVVQLVSVFIVRYRSKYLTHMRSARLPESRLRGEYSMMLGGHLSVEDFAQLTLDLFSDDDDLADCTYILRELSEELVVDSEPTIKSCGFIYDDSRVVSTQHLGLVYEVVIERPDFEIGERGFLLHAKFETIEEIRARRGEFENWSWILMDSFDK